MNNQLEFLDQCLEHVTYEFEMFYFCISYLYENNKLDLNKVSVLQSKLDKVHYNGFILHSYNLIEFMLKRTKNYQDDITYKLFINEKYHEVFLKNIYQIINNEFNISKEKIEEEFLSSKNNKRNKLLSHLTTYRLNPKNRILSPICLFHLVQAMVAVFNHSVDKRYYLNLTFNDIEKDIYDRFIEFVNGNKNQCESFIITMNQIRS